MTTATPNTETPTATPVATPSPLASTPLLGGFAYSVPTIGQIKIGHMDWSAGDRGQPVGDPFITVCAQVKGENGLWNLHPINKKLREDPEIKDLVRRDANGDITALPVRIKFNDLRLVFQDRYEAYDLKLKRQVCSSSGINQPFSCAGAAEARTCPGPAGCAFGVKNRCSLFGRLRVQIPGQEFIDTMGSFIFRTRGYNSVNVLRTKLHYFHALSGGHLAGVPLMLKICAVTKPQSHGRPVYYLDLVLPDGMTEFDAIKAAKKHRDEETAAGYPRAEIEAAMFRLVNNGNFFENEEDAEQLEDLIHDDGDAGGAEAAAEAEPGAPLAGPTGPTVLKSIAGGKAAPGAAKEGVGLADLRHVIDQVESAAAAEAKASAPQPVAATASASSIVI